MRLVKKTPVTLYGGGTFSMSSTCSKAAGEYSTLFSTLLSSTRKTRNLPSTCTNSESITDMFVGETRHVASAPPRCVRAGLLPHSVRLYVQPHPWLDKLSTCSSGAPRRAKQQNESLTRTHALHRRERTAAVGTRFIVSADASLRLNT